MTDYNCLEDIGIGDMKIISFHDQRRCQQSAAIWKLKNGGGISVRALLVFVTPIDTVVCIQIHNKNYFCLEIITIQLQKKPLFIIFKFSDLFCLFIF